MHYHWLLTKQLQKLLPKDLLGRDDLQTLFNSISQGYSFYEEGAQYPGKVSPIRNAVIESENKEAAMAILGLGDSMHLWVEALLESSGLVVRQVTYTEIETCTEAVDFKVLFCDIQLLDSMSEPLTEFFQRIKERGVALVAISSSMRGLQNAVVNYGAVDHLILPMDKDDFVSYARTLLSRSPGQRRDPLFDLTEINQIGRGDPIFLEQMSHVFIEQLVRTLDDMEKARAELDFRRIGAVAHRIKSSLDSFRVMSLVPLVIKLEQYGHSAPDWVDIDQILVRLTETFGVIIDELKSMYPKR